MKKILVLTAALFFSVAGAGSAGNGFLIETGPVPVPLVLLFTSDAAATCNPALAWMTAQKEKFGDSGPWKDFVPAAFHVNNWDVKGYRDPFAKQPFNDLLAQYKRKWGGPNLYAPTVAAGIMDWSGWSRGQDPPRGPDPERRTGRLTVHGGTEEVSTYVASFRPEPSLKDETLMLHAALLGFGLKNKPSEGKNRGRLLTHDFIVTLYRQQEFRSSTGGLNASVELVRPKTFRGEKLAAVFWVTKKGDIEPLQAAGGYLSS